MGRASLLAIPAVFAMAAAAAAQDFGSEWIDRVTHQLVQEKGPLSPRPIDLHLYGGERVYFDDNIFLESSQEDSDTIFVTYGGGTLVYQETNFEAALDALVNYNHYVHEDDASDDEERIMGRARYLAPRWQIEVAEIFRRESDPFSVPQIVERVEKIVSDTVPRVLVGVTGQLSIEARADVQVVKFDDKSFEDIDNVNYRAALTGIYELPNGYDVLADVGYLAIKYSDSTAPEDVQGFFARGGWRGEIQQQRLTLAVLAGVTSAKSEDPDFPRGADGDDLLTADVETHLRFEPTAQAKMTFDYTRRIGFGVGESFQVVNRVTAGMEYDVNPRVKVHLRGVYDYIHGISGLNRDFGSLSGDLTYQLLQYVILDAGLTWRTGHIKDGGSGDFNDVIGSVGAALRW